ncbi:Lsr2 family protein [Streptomyces sp. NPDC059215]|uniref:histone-like nucleoid-structuring protein Lsr2 n=1 Tax=Streptomyces sp. NPDC059215 TaxID=3346772 RepID=UPI003678A49D
MAQKITTIYFDDLSGNESEEVSTHVFSLDGVTYEIDLVPENYDRLYDALAPFIEKGRKTGRAKALTRPRKTSEGGPSAEAIRAWARENGVEVSPRGRIPATVREQYEATN